MIYNNFKKYINNIKLKLLKMNYSFIEKLFKN